MSKVLYSISGIFGRRESDITPRPIDWPNYILITQ